MSLGTEERRAALDRILTSPEFAQSPRMAQLLRFLVDYPAQDVLKETVIGVGVFARDPGYDPKLDPVVRVEARRLRTKLMEYYEGSGRADAVRLDLPKGSYRPVFAATALPLAPGAARPARWPLAAAGGVIVAGFALWWWWPAREVKSRAAQTLRQITAGTFNARAPVFSPDGQEILFSRDAVDGRSHLLRLALNQNLTQTEPTAVTSGDVHDFEPAWSPTGDIAFLRARTPADYSLMLIQGGAEPREVAKVGVRSPLSFTPDGASVIASDRDGPTGPIQLARVQLSDGRKERLTQPPTGAQGDLSPRVSPDGRQVAFLRAVEASVQDIWLVPLNAGAPPRRLTHENQPFEGLDWAPDGRSLVAAFERGPQPRSLWRIDAATGATERMAEAGLGPLAPAVARRGGRVAFVLRFADTNLWRAELTGTKPPRALTNTPQLDTSPQIAPNGDIAFRSNRSGTNEVWLLTGGHARKLTAMNGPVTGSARWSPDGKRLVFDSRPSNHGDLFLLPASGGTPQRLTEEPSNEAVPSWSHDGQAIYFASDRTGDWEVFRMPAVGGAAERLTSQGGFAPFASRDGRWIYYAKRTGDGGLWRRRLSEPGAREERVAPLTPNFWGQWALGAKGLFYAVFSVEGAKAIRRLDLASGQTRDVVMLDRMPVQFDSGMAVAPDEAWLCWSQLDAAGSDIYVMDGAR